MGLTLSKSWNLATAMGELMSSLLLVFLIMTIFAKANFLNKKNNGISSVVKSALFALSALISIFGGKAFGNLISAQGDINGDQSLGLGTPLFALLTSFSYGLFDALPMMIGFQAIGSIIGFLLYILFAYSFKQNHKNFDWKDGLVINRRELKPTVFTELTAQILVSLTVVLISSMSQEIIGSNVFTNSFVLVLGLFVIIFLFSSTGFFVVSPFIDIISLIASTITNGFEKKLWINITTQIFIYLSIASLLGGFEYQIRY